MGDHPLRLPQQHANNRRAIATDQLQQMSGSGDRSNMTPPSSEATSQDPMELDQAASASQEISDPEVEVEEGEMMSDKLKKYLWEKLVKLGKAVYQMIIWLLYLLGSYLGILWIVFNMWICSLVSTEFEKLGAGRDGSFIIGMTVGLLDYFFAFFENLETKNRCIIWCFQTPPNQNGDEERDSPARRALQEREADKPPSYKDCVKKSYSVKLPAYLKTVKEEEEGPPDYTTAVGGIV